MQLQPWDRRNEAHDAQCSFNERRSYTGGLLLLGIAIQRTHLLMVMVVHNESYFKVQSTSIFVACI